MEKLIITAALTGNITFPAQTPYLPLTPILAPFSYPNSLRINIFLIIVERLQEIGENYRDWVRLEKKETNNLITSILLQSCLASWESMQCLIA